MVDDALVRTSDRRAFMTLFYGLLDPADGTLRYLDAGHPFPLVRRANGRVDELGEGALPLGIVRGVRARPAATRLDPGDLVVLYSDGLPEALDPDGGSFGFDRVARVVSDGGSASSVHDRLLAEVDAFCAHRPADDDRSVVIIRRLE
jgi:sigma-B regulation protein RsbU (phosphoserine phosphatase)